MPARIDPPLIDLRPGEYRQTSGPRRKEKAINWLNLAALVIALTISHYVYKFLWAIAR